MSDNENLFPLNNTPNVFIALNALGPISEMIRMCAGVRNRLAPDFQLPQSDKTPTAPALTREGSVRSNNTSVALNHSREIKPEALTRNCSNRTVQSQPTTETASQGN